VIYREMPPIRDRDFAARFYARWGKENAVISARTRYAEYPPYTQLLSIKMLTGGREEYFLDGRTVCVDDDTFLILNRGRRYGSCIDTLRPCRSFSVFFRPGLAEEAQAALTRSTESLVDLPFETAVGQVEFDEHLRDHDATVYPVLRYLRSVVDSGHDDELWLEEQLGFLLAQMLRLERGQRKIHELLPRSRPGTRQELMRRLGLAVNFIHAHYQEPIELRDIARAAHLSPFHFMRILKSLYGTTPSACLRQKRVNAAVRLLRDSSCSVAEIAEQVGFGCRATLLRHLRAHRGMSARELRALTERPEAIA
jgi:AraC family transcriptional regulator